MLVKVAVREAEVNYLDLPVNVGQHHVAWFQVEMQHLPAVHVAHGRKHLGHESPEMRLVLEISGVLADKLGKRESVNILRQEVRGCAVIAHRNVPDNVWMVEVETDVKLLLKRRDVCRITRKLGFELLQEMPLAVQLDTVKVGRQAVAGHGLRVTNGKRATLCVKRRSVECIHFRCKVSVFLP